MDLPPDFHPELPRECAISPRDSDALREAGALDATRTFPTVRLHARTTLHGMRSAAGSCAAAISRSSRIFSPPPQ